MRRDAGPTATGRYTLAPGAVFKTVGGRPALYLSSNRSLHVLSATAELVCRCLEAPATVDELADRLARATDGERATIVADLEEIVPDFVDRRILAPVGRGSRSDP